MLKQKIFLTAKLAILGAFLLQVSFGQTPSLSQEQLALQIISQRYAIPISELTFVHKATIDEGITRIKVLHVPATQVYVVNLDAQNHEVDDATIQQILSAHRGRWFIGKLERALADAAKTGNPNELIKVDVWLKPGTNPPQLDRDAPESVRQAQLEAIKSYHAVLRKPVEDFVTHNNGQVIYGSQLAPLVHVAVPKSLINLVQSQSFTLDSSQPLTQSLSLQSLPEVDTLYLTRQLQTIQQQRIPYSPSLDHSTRAINADNFWSAGFRGSGIKIAAIEFPSGGTGIDYSQPYLADGTYCHPEDGPLRSDHATEVAGVIASTHPYL